MDDHHDKGHGNTKRFQCGFCDAKFSWVGNLYRHERTHIADTHDCPHCNKGFLDAQRLRTHVSSRHVNLSDDRERPFLCRLCGKCFRYDFSYDAHMSSHKIPVEQRAAALVVLNNGSGKTVTKQFNIELISEPGQANGHSVSVDPYAFIERFVELPIFEDARSEDDGGASSEESTEDNGLSRVGVTQVLEYVADDATDTQALTLQRELTTDSKVNGQDELKAVENSSEKEHEAETVTHRRHVGDQRRVVSAVTVCIDDRTYDDPSTVKTGTTQTKRRQCDVSNHEENVNTKCLCYGTSSVM